MEKLFESSGMVVKSYVYLIILQFTVNLSCKSQGMDRTFSDKIVLDQEQRAPWLPYKSQLAHIGIYNNPYYVN